MSFEEFTGQIDIPKDKALEILESEGIVIPDSSASIRDIARENNTSPVALYDILKAQLASGEKQKLEEITAPKKQSLGGGGGYGWKTLENLAQDLDISIQDIMEFLHSQGIDAQKHEVIRDVATKNGLKAYELVDKIRKIKE
jgi:hypothetical protein